MSKDPDSRPITYGGQAVLEGVMMRGPGHLALAMRRSDGGIQVQRKPIKLWTTRGPWRRIPIIRGNIALVESLVLGIDALLISANEVAEEEGEKLGWAETTLVLALAFGLAIGLFMLVPTWLMGLLKGVIESPLWLNLCEGIMRLVFLLIYISAISASKDIYRVYQYHGAEHKTIHAYESGEPLTVSAARGYSTLHPRCGTAFLLFVAVVALLIFTLFGWPSFWIRTLTRLALLPVIAGLSFELIRAAGRSNWAVMRLLIQPGLWLQRVTTREPDDEQLEVAIAALNTVVEREGRLA